jgi:hypothetical protein
MELPVHAAMAGGAAGRGNLPAAQPTALPVALAPPAEGSTQRE